MSLSTFISTDRDSAHIAVYKSFPKLILLIFLIAVIYRSFLASILFNVELFLETLMEGMVFLYVAFRLAKRGLEKNWSVNPIEIYLGILFLFPILPAIAAIKEFDQPFLYGLATYRDWYLLFGGLMIYNMLKSGDLEIKLVERAFATLAVIFMLFGYFLTAFVDPRQFQDTAISGSNSAKGEDVYYRLNMALFFFGAVYFTVKAFYKKSFIYLLVAGLFIYYVIFIRLDRTSIAVMLGGLGLFFTTGIRARNQALALMQAILPIMSLALLVYFFAPQIYTQYYGMFLDVLDTAGAAGSGSVDDDVRLMELDIAIRGIKENPFFGHGKVSTYFVENGYSHFYGFFYTSDLGFFGYLFSSGIVGLIIIFAQFYFFFKYIFSIKHIKNNVFLVTLKYTVIILALDGITTEYLVLYAGQTILLIMLLRYFYEEDKKIGQRLLLENAKGSK